MERATFKYRERRVTIPERFDAVRQIYPTEIQEEWEEVDVDGLAPHFCGETLPMVHKKCTVTWGRVVWGGDQTTDDFLAICIGGVLASNVAGWMMMTEKFLGAFEGYGAKAKEGDVIDLPVEVKIVEEEDESWDVHFLTIKLPRGRFVEVLGVILTSDKFLESCIAYLLHDEIHYRQIAAIFFQGVHEGSGVPWMKCEKCVIQRKVWV